VHYSTVGPMPMSGAVISNHLTYIDILVHAAIRPCVFVSKAELRQTPVLGWMSMMAGTVYVERGAGGSAARAAAGMGKGFRDGLPVVFFPEGTTGVGDEAAMPFRSGLLAQAIAAEAIITPGFITYTISPKDLTEGKSTRNDVHWGPQTLLAHIWNFLGLRTLNVSIRFAEKPIQFTEKAITDRKLAALEAREAVLALTRPLEEPIRVRVL
jgi:1-acyl-sn-glycerol-3-phosphate acyltransferase